jgi:homoserine dehydrogenase
MLAFRRRIDPAGIERAGIRNLAPAQFVEAGRRGLVVKLIAAATQDGHAIGADVRPRLIPADTPLARVRGAMNAIAIESEYAGPFRFEGPGAGPDAAASAVLADIIRAARDAPASAGALLAGLADQPTAKITPLGSLTPYPAVA